MNPIVERILEELEDDLVSHGWLAQCVRQGKCDDGGQQFGWKDMLEELLQSGQVEIGTARIASADYVEFIAWNGTVDERVARAAEQVDAVPRSDREFAYWLCLHSNTDGFETDE